MLSELSPFPVTTHADRDHRSYVGPARHYDFLGASQFRLLSTLGLRAGHKVLDFGCGSLRAGRLLIPYLDRGGYFGVEPNEWLVTEGIEQEIGQDLVRLKQPQFSNNENFEVAEFGQCFDFILAQSIFSHTGRNLVELALANFSPALAPGGLIAATFINGVDYHVDDLNWPGKDNGFGELIIFMYDELEVPVQVVDHWKP